MLDTWTRRPALTHVPADDEAFPGNLGRQHPAAMAGDACRHALTSLRLTQKNHTAASAGAADLGSQSALAGGSLDKFLDQRCGDAGSVGLTQLPLFAQQPGNLGPMRLRQRLAHGAGNFPNALEVAEDFAVMVDVGLKDLPVVDP